jgi:UPF0755 protein
MAAIHHQVIRVVKIVTLAFALTFSLSLLLLVAGFVYFDSPPTATPSSFEEGFISFEVRKGETPRTIGRRLEEEGIIKDYRFWYLLSRFGEGGQIQAGIYEIPFPASQRDIRSTLLLGAKEVLHKVTVPEGATLTRTARILDNASICSAEDFLRAASSQEILDIYSVPGETMEGFLFPDTYFFPSNYSARLVVKAMADNFFKRLAVIHPGALEMDPKELFRKVILASIVEREYRVSEEAGIMAGVFFNRLNIRMPLQSCATVEYVITEILGKPHPRVIYTRDTQINNPYNTYFVSGLPPGPISAPGSVALDAVFNPIESEYLYFRLIDGSAGRHYFSRTFDDHIRAGDLYVKGS